MTRDAIATIVEDLHDAFLRELVDAPVSDESSSSLEVRIDECGLGPSQETLPVIHSMAQRLFVASINDEVVAGILRVCGTGAWPAAAIRNFLRFLERIGDPTVFLGTITRARPLLQMVGTVFGASQYMSDILVRNPGYVYWLMEQRTWDAPDTVEGFTAWLERDAAPFRRPEGRIGAFHRTHRQAMLKIGIQDLLGQSPLEDTVRKLSNLADAVSRAVLDAVFDEAAVSREVPVDTLPRAIAVIAMGKHGGRELNYSSDIDLIYVCRDADEDEISLYTRVARRFTEIMSEATPEGYFYRVDLRLRPDGQSGPIVNNETAARLYYEHRGRPWEFQAMLKARTIAGDFDLGNRLLDSLTGLVFNPTLPYSPLEAISAMRDRIRDNIPAHERGFNIKLMGGGIRDIEFIAQTLQLVHGTRHRELRGPNTLEVLFHVRRLALLKEVEVDNLAEAYRFFRIVEHRLQMMHQLKTHTVPDSDEEIALLARRVSCGPLGTWDHTGFLEILSRHLGNVRAIAESFFSGEDVHPHSVLLMLPADDPRARAIIHHYGIEDTAHALRTLHTLAYGAFPRLLDRTTRRAFEELLPFLLEGVAPMGDPGAALVNVSSLATAGRNESSFYKMLAGSEAARDLLFGIAGFSSYLARRLSVQMDVLDSLLRAGDDIAFETHFRQIAEWDRFHPDIARAGGAPAVERQARQRAWFDRTRLHDFATGYRRRFRPLRGGAARSWVAARQLSQAFDAAIPDAAGAALFAMGSYAVDEARMFSDVDLLVVTSGADVPRITDSVQLVNRWFSDGGILRLDFRLRGEGASAPLVQDISFYREYAGKRMGLWERIAFAKCRAWWGDKELQKQFYELLRESVARPFEAPEIAELIAMRRRIETLAPKKFRVWDTKRAAGGRYDIEYLCAIGLSRVATQDSDFFAMTTGERIDRLAERRVITADERTVLLSAQRLFSLVEYLMELQEFAHPRSVEKNQYLGQYLDRALSFLEISAPHGAETLLEHSKTAVRRCFEEALRRMQ